MRRKTQPRPGKRVNVSKTAARLPARRLMSSITSGKYGVHKVMANTRIQITNISMITLWVSNGDSMLGWGWNLRFKRARSTAIRKLKLVSLWLAMPLLLVFLR
ncbi:hypothetical protein GOBAR_DD26086 [Gossypium barbadense]|nr:hypothetical protein GOBAR_DD26086 [Gossypium barbadense]